MDRQPRNQGRRSRRTVGRGPRLRSNSARNVRWNRLAARQRRLPDEGHGVRPLTQVGSEQRGVAEIVHPNPAEPGLIEHRPERSLHVVRIVRGTNSTNGLTRLLELSTIAYAFSNRWNWRSAATYDTSPEAKPAAWTGGIGFLLAAS